MWSTIILYLYCSTYLENYDRIVSCKMKGSFEKFHDWFYKWFFEHNKKVQRFGNMLKYDLPMDPKQQVWTTVKENGNGSKTRFKHKVTEKTHYSCGTCFILMVMASMAIIVVVFVTMSDNLFYDQPLKSKFFFPWN